MRVLDLTALKKLESSANEGRGVQCVKSIIVWLERGEYALAKNAACIENDKIRNYPEIKDELCAMGVLKRVHNSTLGFDLTEAGDL